MLNTKKRADGVARGEDPEFKPQYCKKNNNNNTQQKKGVAE
jgi:hypothetical protein